MLRLLTVDRSGVDIVSEVSAQLEHHVARIVSSRRDDPKLAAEAKGLIQNLRGRTKNQD